MRKLFLAGAATALAAAPIAAQSTDFARASAPATEASELGGGGAGIYAIAFVAGIAAIVALTAFDDDDEPLSAG